MNVTLIIIISFFISVIWLYYFRMIDVFEHEKPALIILTFIIGTLFPFIIYPIHTYIYEPIGIGNSEDTTFNFLFYTLGVGLLEELVKAFPVLVIYRIFKNAINEPLDFVVYICVSALGFAFGENVEYAVGYGEYILLSRSVLSVPAHMFFSSIFIYGFLLYKFHSKDAQLVLYYVFFAMIAHGLFDYLLVSQGLPGFVITIIFLLFMVSTFIIIVNNCLNNSAFYTPKKTIDQHKVMGRMLGLYLLTVVAIFIAVISNGEELVAQSFFIVFTMRDVPILYILIVRLSRISIIPGLWRKMKLEFPLKLKGDLDMHGHRPFELAIRGESYNDYHISLLYEEDIYIIPISSRKSFLNVMQKARIEKKLYLNEEAVFLVRLYLDSSGNRFKHFFLVAKKHGTTHTDEDHPIASINSIKSSEKRQMVFHEWVILKKAG